MKLFAHRGDLDDHPENTIEGMLAALDEGADGIEFDVGRSVDGVWYLMHDASVDRTTDGTGSIKNLTAAYLDSLHIVGGEGYRSWDHGTRYSVPRLLDVLDACEPYMGAEFIFHVKPSSALAFGEIAQLMVDRDIVGRSWFLADVKTYLPNVKAVEPTIRTIYAAPYETPASGVDFPLLERSEVDRFQDIDQYPAWDTYVSVGDTGELTSIAKALQWGARNCLVNGLHDALAYTFGGSYPMPDSIKVFPSGAIPNGVTSSNTAGDAYLMPIVLPDVNVKGLSIRTKTANTGTVRWGLFDLANDLVAEGQGTLVPGWCNLDAATPTAASAGAYQLVVAQPATAAPTFYIVDGGTGPLVYRALTYTWTDPLVPATFGTPYVGPITCFLYGD